MAKYWLPCYRILIGLAQCKREDAARNVATILRKAADDVERDGLPLRPNEFRRIWDGSVAGVAVVTNRSNLKDIWTDGDA